ARAADPHGDCEGKEHDRRHEHDDGGRHHRRSRVPDRGDDSKRGQEGVTLGPGRAARAVLLIVLLTTLVVAAMPATRAQGPRVLLADVTGAIDRSHVEYISEAIAVGTTIGSDQPVTVGPTGVEPVTDAKIVNAVVGILEGQMALHGRDNNVTIDGRDMKLADWFVRENLNLNPADAQRYFASN